VLVRNVGLRPGRVDQHLPGEVVLGVVRLPLVHDVAGFHVQGVQHGGV